jgi:probable rRNA maturation factor
MKLILEINNQTSYRLSGKRLERAIKETIALSGVIIKSISISLAIVSNKEIKKINRIYRKRNKSTDILSFAPDKQDKIVKNSEDCELIISPEYIEKSAQKNKVSFERELMYVISHGMLHCLNFRHGKKMYAIQDEVCKKFK